MMILDYNYIILFFRGFIVKAVYFSSAYCYFFATTHYFNFSFSIVSKPVSSKIISFNYSLLLLTILIITHKINTQIIIIMLIILLIS